MRQLVGLILVVLAASGCRHGSHTTRCAPGADVQYVQGAPEVVREQPECAAPGEKGACAPGDAPGCEAVPKCGPTAPAKSSCRVPEIHVNVPPAQVVIRREERERVRERPAAAPRPEEDVMLVPTTVFVPYKRMTPTGPVRMAPLAMTPVQPPAAAPPCANPPAAPPPCNPPAAPPPCANPPAAPCPPGAPSCAVPGAGPVSPGPTIEGLNKRCSELENKIDALIDALNKSRSK